MEFIKLVVDKKLIQKQDIGINPILIENNLKQIENIIKFLNSETSLLLVNGFMGTGKVMVVNQALSFVDENVITLKYNCFETTILDDILLEFFESFKKLTAQNIIQQPKAKSENFTQKINAYFESINKPILIVINSFEQVLLDEKNEILDFLNHLSKFANIKTIIISRKFDYSDFKTNFERISISALEKNLFEKYLKSENFKQIGPISDELYKHTRGYYFYTTLSIKIMQERKLSLTDFLSGHSKSFLSFNDFILREALSLVDPVSGHLFRFLAIMRHPVNMKLLQTLNLYDADRIAYFVDNMILTREKSLIYLQDYYKTIAENSIAQNIAIKIHKSCVELYNTQLPLKPLERDLLISRQTMRKEIEYHSLFIPKKPIIQPKEIIEPQVIIKQTPQITPEEKIEEIKKISFVFESEENETTIMNKIANSINRFVDISDKKSKDLDEIEKLSLVNLINLAKNEERNYDYAKVAMIYQKALTLNNDDDFYTFLPTIYTKLANAFKNMSDWFNALKYFELAIEFFVSTGDTEKINECKYEIANIFYMTFKPERAEKLLSEICYENISINLKLKAQLLLFDINGQLPKDILPQDTKDINLEVLTELYFKYALICDDNGDIENAVRYYKKCIETTQDPKLNKFLSSSLANLANIFDENGKTDMAIKYLLESQRLDILNNNYNGIYMSSMKLAEIHNDPLKALEYLHKAKEYATRLNETFYIISADFAIGDYYYNKKMYKDALKNFYNALNIAKQNNDEINTKKIELRINDIKKVYNAN